MVNQWRNVTFTDCDHSNPDYPPNCVASGEEIFAQLNFEEVIIATLIFLFIRLENSIQNVFLIVFT